MEKGHLSRKLAVLLHADVVGSTLLVQNNETLAHERIQDTFRRFSNTISSYGGVALEIRGDALVAEFGTVSDAVSVSLAFQAIWDTIPLQFEKAPSYARFQRMQTKTKSELTGSGK